MILLKEESILVQDFYANIAVSREPFNYQCKILGFDTFKGSKGVTAKDKSSKIGSKKRRGI